MGAISKDEINVSLFDEIRRLNAENYEVIAERDSLKEQLQKAQEKIVTREQLAVRAFKAATKADADKAEAVMIAVKALRFVCAACVELNKNYCNNCTLKNSDIKCIERITSKKWEELGK